MPCERPTLVCGGSCRPQLHVRLLAVGGDGEGSGKSSRGTPCLHCGTLNHVARKKCKTCGATTMAGAKEKPTIIKKNIMESHLSRFGFSASADYETGIVSL